MYNRTISSASTTNICIPVCCAQQRIGSRNVCCLCAKVQKVVLPTLTGAIGYFQCLSSYGVSSIRCSMLWSPDFGRFLSRAQGCIALFPQETPVLEDLYRQGVCRGTRGVVEARGHHALSARVSLPRAVARSSSTSIWTIQII